MFVIFKQLGMNSVLLALFAVSAVTASETAKDAVISKAGEEAGGFIITVEIPRLSYRVGEYISLTVRLKNVGPKELRLRKDTLYTMYEITVTAEDGTAIPKTRFGQKQAWGLAFPRGGGTTLASGQERSVSLPINRLFDMTLAGKYTIVISKQIAAPESNSVKVSAPSLVLAVTE